MWRQRSRNGSYDKIEVVEDDEVFLRFRIRTPGKYQDSGKNDPVAQLFQVVVPPQQDQNVETSAHDKMFCFHISAQV
jgi:hypothetical protein